MVGCSLIAVCLVSITNRSGPDGAVGRIVALSGEVHVQGQGIPAVAAVRGDYLHEGDIVETGSEGNVRLLMRDKSVLALPSKSRLEIAAYQVHAEARQRQARLKVLAGRLWALVSQALHPDARYEVTSGTAVAGVRGTELVFDVADSGQAAVTVISGVVDLAAAGAHETLGERERGRIGGTGAIAIGSTSASGIETLRDDVRDEQALDEAKAEQRLAALRKKKGANEAAVKGPAIEPEQGARDAPGTGSATFEDAPVDAGDVNGDSGSPTADLFDPSTMARVRISVQVRP